MAYSALRALSKRFRQVSLGVNSGQCVAAQQGVRGDAARRPLAADASTHNVPAGHKGSDLSDSVCNISLQRMRDLTLRQDLKFSGDSGEMSLKDAFQGHRSLLVGLPGGKTCAEQHLPGFLKKLNDLSSKELDKVICIVPQDCKLLKAKREASKGNAKIMFLEDPGNGFARMLGMDRIGDGPPTQRYAGIVENGILLKLAVEKHPREVDVSSIDSVLKLWDYLNSKPT